MKKIILLFFFFAFAGKATFANGVDVNYAQQVAQNFYSQMAGKAAELTLAYQATNTDASNGLALGEPLLYVFNAAGNKGFVIIAADDAASPVLGYSFEGKFVIQNAPPVIADWYKKYSGQVAVAKLNHIAAKPATALLWNNYYNNVANTAKQARAGGAVGPLLTTTWDQDLYYNSLCPQDGGAPNGFGGRVPTGCGATAMSQIMRYWGYPAHGTGSTSYNSNYGTLSANFAGATYNWANMPNSVTSANNDVATIMYHCGVAVDMTYEAQESLSYMTGSAPSCQSAYTTYFGYDPATIQGLQKNNYNIESDWTNLILNELNNSRPVQYAGTGSQGGHTFIIDGTDGAGNFHVNWGWSGADNGFYGIDALDPQPYANGSFDANESMIIGIQPLNVTVTAPGIDLYAAVTVAPNPIPFLTSFTVSTNLINHGSAAFNGSYCAALFDNQGNFIRLIGDILSTNGTALPAGSYYNGGLIFSDTTQAVTVPGVYTIGIFYQASNSNLWNLAGAGSYTNPINVTVSGPIDDISLYSNITANPATLIQGQAATISANLLNAGTATYYGQYEAVLLDLDGNFVEQLGTYSETVGLPAGDVYNTPLPFTINNVTAPEGLYILAIAENQTGINNWYYCGGQTYQNPVLIAVVNPGINVLAINEVETNALKVYPNPATNLITIEAGNATGNYNLKMFNALGQQVKESTGVLNGKVQMDVADFAAGMYTIQLKAETGLYNAKVIVK